MTQWHTYDRLTWHDDIRRDEVRRGEVKGEISGWVSCGDEKEEPKGKGKNLGGIDGNEGAVG